MEQEEIDKLISEMEAAGASDDEIASIIDERLKSSKHQLKANTINVGGTDIVGGFETSSDPLVSLAKGGVDLLKAGVGLTGLVSGGYIPKGIDAASNALFGGTLEDLSQNIQSYKSIPLQLQEEKLNQVEGFKNTVTEYAKNPSAIAGAVTESLPSMFGGAGIGRLIGGKLIPLVAAGVGEGVVASGSVSEDLRQGNEDKLLTAGQTGASVLSGALTSGFGILGGKIAGKLGVEDIDMLLTSGRTDIPVKTKLTSMQRITDKVYKTLAGAVTESTFEELPQSFQEEILKGLASGKTWEESVDIASKSAASGWVTGFVTGGGANMMSAKQTKVDAIDQAITELDNESGHPEASQVPQEVNAQEAQVPQEVNQQPVETPVPTEQLVNSNIYSQNDFFHFTEDDFNKDTAPLLKDKTSIINLIESSPYAELFKKLKEDSNVDFDIINSKDYKWNILNPKPLKADRYTAWFDKSRNSIQLNTLGIRNSNMSSKGLVHTLVHEYTHAAFNKKLKSEDRNTLSNIFKQIKKDYKGDYFYGLDNVDEAIAEYFTNRDFQEFIKKQSYTKQQSFFDRIKQIIFKTLNLDERSFGQILDSYYTNKSTTSNHYQSAIETAKQSPNLEVTEVDGKLRVKILNEAGSSEAQELSYLSKTRRAQTSDNVETVPVNESTVKGDIKESIRPTSEKITSPEYTLLKDKIRNIARGVRMGNIDAKTAIKDVGKHLQDIISGQQLSPKQQNAVLGRATKVNFNSPEQVNKLMDYTDKVVADAQYNDKLGKAKSTAKTINSKKKGGKFASFTPMVQRLLQIDPETLSNEDLEVYQTTMNELDKKVPNVASLKYNIDNLVTNSSNTKEVSNLSSIPQIREYIGGIEPVTDFDSFSGAKSRINQAKRRLYNLGKQGVVDEAEAEAFSNEIDALDEQINKASEAFESQVAELKKDRIKQANILLGTLPEYSKQDNEQIDKFKKINLSEKSMAEVEDYYRIAEGLTNGFVNKSMYDFISKDNKQKNIKEYKGIAEKATREFAKIRTFFGLFNVKGINPVKDPRKLLNELKLLHGQRWDRKMLLGKDRPIQEKVFTPINAKTKISETETNIEQKKAKTFTTKLKQDSRIKVGMILNQLDYASSKQESQPADKMRFLLNDANSYEDAKPVMGLATLDKYAQIWKAMPKDSNGDMDVEAAIKSLSSEERKAMNGIKDEVFGNEDFQGKTKVITEMRGEVWTPHADYFPNYVQQRVRKGKDADTSTASFVDDALALDRKGLGMRSGRSYQRTGQIYFTELDVDKVADKTIKEVNRDYYLTEPVRDNIGAMNMAASEMEGEQRGMFDAMYQAMKDRVVTEYNLKFSESDPLNNFMDWYLSFRRTMALSNPLRVPYDFTANMVRQGIANGFNAGSFSNPVWAELKKENDSVTVGKTNKYKQEQVRPSETRSGQIADELMGLGDVPVVNISYVTAFKNRFKELTGQEFDITQYSDTAFREQNADNIRKASSWADAQVQDMFNSQSTFMAPSKTKITPLDTELTDKKTVVAKMFGFMQSFTTNEAAEVMQSFRDLAYNTNEGRVKAARRIGAMGMSNYVYMNGAMVMMNMLRAAVDDDKELEDLLAEQFAPEKQFEILLASMGSLAVGRYGNLVRPILTLMLSGMYDILDKGGFSNQDELKEDLDVLNDISNTTFYTGYKPLNLRYDKPDKALRLIPTIGDALGDAVVLGNSITDLMNKDPDTMADDERATYDMLILLNKTAAFAYKNPVSPTLDRLLRAKKSSITKATSEAMPPDGFILPEPELPSSTLPEYAIPNFEIPQY